MVETVADPEAVEAGGVRFRVGMGAGGGADDPRKAAAVAEVTPKNGTLTTGTCSEMHTEDQTCTVGREGVRVKATVAGTDGGVRARRMATAEGVLVVRESRGRAGKDRSSNSCSDQVVSVEQTGVGEARPKPLLHTSPLLPPHTHSSAPQESHLLKY